MKTEIEKKLANMLRATRTAGLGTIRDGFPLVSMVAYLPADDFSVFYIHVSTLAQHTQDLLAEPRAGLLVNEPDDAQSDPQTLARISILGTAEQIASDDANYADIRTRYIARFPQSAPLFNFGDFGLWQIVPRSARFVAGFAQAFNLTPDTLRKISQA